MDQRRTSVLVVEDNPGDARLIQEYLRESPAIDASLTLVSTLAAAVEVLQTEQIDIVLLDLSLSDSSGLYSIRTLIRTAPTTPIVVLNGNEDRELILQAVQVGAQDYLPKQDASSDILSRIMSNAIERQSMRVELDTLARIGRVISSSLNIDSVFEVVACEVRSLLPLDRMVVMWHNTDMNRLDQRHMWNSGKLSGDVSLQPVVPLHSRQEFRSMKKGVIGWGEPFFEKSGGLRAEHESRNVGLAATMFAPLIAGDEAVGLLSAAAAVEDAYSTRHLRLLETIANQISGAIRAADLYDKAMLWNDEREHRVLLQAQK